MTKTAMPSPHGTNKERLFLAFDADPDVPDNDGSSSVAQKVFEALQEKMKPDDMAELLQLMMANSTDMATDHSVQKSLLARDIAACRDPMGGLSYDALLERVNARGGKFF